MYKLLGVLVLLGAVGCSPEEAPVESVQQAVTSPDMGMADKPGKAPRDPGSGQ